MMDLVLKVVDGPSNAGWRGLAARFDASGGLIGRAETARLSLPDSSRTVSRFHAHVSCSGGEFFLEDMGSRNAATINGRALASGSKEPLRPGDRVCIGRFVLSAQWDDPDFPATQLIDRPQAPAHPDGDDQHTRARVVGREASGRVHPRTHHDLLAALCDGAGIELELAKGMRPEFMNMLGQVVRALGAGMRRLTEQRERWQSDLLAGRTRSRPLQVDPIRSASEDSRWLAALLQSAERGSASPCSKAEALVEDLVAHLDAMGAAVDAAVDELEKRLAPAALEQRLRASLVLDELLPSRRKARLWDLYCRAHAAEDATAGGAPSEASDDGKDDVIAPGASLRELFEREFARAYDAQQSRPRRSAAGRL